MAVFLVLWEDWEGRVTICALIIVQVRAQCSAIDFVVLLTRDISKIQTGQLQAQLEHDIKPILGGQCWTIKNH